MVIAFIPVRGGSKSIPLKNIKDFCGKPLVCWNIEALEKCKLVDKIIIATDSPEIAKVVSSQNYKKTHIYWRSAENAIDTASTESVMLEYLKKNPTPPNCTFILAQATSPMTRTEHFTEALTQYNTENIDSLLSCVRNFRFFWNKDGTSKNYDYKNRPRRQDFNGELMENGAFYINSVSNILNFQNRLCGKIGIYIMPEYTAAEIDEPDDWIILESLMKRHVLSNPAKKSNSIELFVSDVDGTLTDGGMYYSESGEELKKFNTRDGMGFQMLHNAGIKTGIITSENTSIVERRAEKLNIDFLIQGKKFNGKLDAIKVLCKKENISLEKVAYIGDDINCIELLKNVGYAACPIDAQNAVKEIPGIKILSLRGGEGVVREFIDLLLQDNDNNEAN